eukprot:9426564-Pyramimonas_sp.AAC.1
MSSRWRTGMAGSLAPLGSSTRRLRPPYTSAIPLDVGDTPLPRGQREQQDNKRRLWAPSILSTMMAPKTQCRSQGMSWIRFRDLKGRL